MGELGAGQSALHVATIARERRVPRPQHEHIELHVDGEGPACAAALSVEHDGFESLWFSHADFFTAII